MLSQLVDSIYRLVYGGLLARLPEARAVRIGQSLFRSLPVAPLRTLAVDDPRLTVDLAGVRLPGPLILYCFTDCILIRCLSCRQLSMCYLGQFRNCRCTGSCAANGYDRC